MECISTCKLFKYNKVHNNWGCYRNAPDCILNIGGDIPVLEVPEDPEDDEAIEDPSLP